jgi:lysine-N-methylase
MKITKPSFFDTFRCIAEHCPDSCCKEWDVQVDPEFAAYYRGLPGALGDRLRSVLKDEDGETYMVIEDGRCPMWREDGLCRLQAELGEQALCRTCREFPRLTHDYGDFLELGLEMSCPEAARLLLAEDWQTVTEELPGDGEAEYDEEAMDVLKATRSRVLEILTDTAVRVQESLALALLYGCQAQGELDGEEEMPFDGAAALETCRELAAKGEIEEILPFFAGLEILTPQWKTLLEAPRPMPWREEFRRIARYFVERYWLQAVSDYDLYSRVKLMVVSCMVIREIGGDLAQTAQLYSKEIENSIGNVEAILDAAYTHSAFTDDKLLALLLN